MTIFIGDAVLVGNDVQVKSPLGFDSVDGVRLTNYTGDVLIVQGIESQNPTSREYLMPLQQMIYKANNVSTPPTLTGVQLGNSIDTPAVFVEWSDDMVSDFIGTYPTAISAVSFDQSFASVRSLALPAADTTVEVPSAPRDSITVINAGSTNIKWNTADADWADAPIILPGSGRTLNTRAALFFQSDAVNGLLEVDED